MVSASVWAGPRSTRCTVLSPTWTSISPTKVRVGGVTVTPVKSNLRPMVSNMNSPPSPMACQFLVMLTKFSGFMAAMASAVALAEMISASATNWLPST